MRKRCLRPQRRSMGDNVKRPRRAVNSSRHARILVWLLLVLSGLGSAVYGQNSPGENSLEGEAAPVYIVDIKGTINPGATGLLDHAIKTATTAKAAALIVRINTPGGLLSSTRDMVSAIDQSQVPIIGYVGPAGASATSAGAFILLSTHVAVMNAGTNVGASSPVAGDGGDIEGTMGKKVMNDSKAFMRSVASSRERDADVAERFVSDAESLTAHEAEKNDVIDLVVTEFSELVPKLNGHTITFHGQPLTLHLDTTIHQVEMRLIDRLLKYIAHPQIAHMLISLGMLAIYIEILSPGLAFPGVLGVIAVVLGLVGIQTLPVNVGFLILLFLGLVLMVSEYFVAGFGVLGIGGAVAFTFGSINLFDTPLTVEYKHTIMSVTIAVSGAILLTSFLITRSMAFGARHPKKLEGMTGEAMVSFDKSGFILVDEQRWPADTLEPLHHGDQVVVVSHDAEGRLVVRKANDETPRPGLH